MSDIEGSEGNTNTRASEPSGASWLEKVAIPLAAAILAVLGSFWATTLANNTATSNQRAVFAEQRAQIERDKRADAYLKFLDAADALAGRASALNNCLATVVPPVQLSSSTSPTGCQDKFNERLDTHRVFVAARNQVYVFGSVVANVEAAAMGDALLLWNETYNSGQHGSEASISPAHVVISFPWWPDRFVQHYKAFQQVMCREVPANPRTNC